MNIAAKNKIKNMLLMVILAAGAIAAAGATAVAADSSVAPTLARFDWIDYQGSDPSDVAPLGADQYRNPIVKGFYPDPSITRVGETYYLVNSTFGYFPGLPIFKSRDLVSWTQIANAIDRPEQVNFANIDLSRGLYAPAISYHAGRFFILNTCVKCGGNFIITAPRAEGPWSDPVWLPQMDGDDGYDPALFFDDDGRSWIVSNGPPDGPARYRDHRAIWLQQFDLATLKLIGPRTVIVDGGVKPQDDPSWIEGPHLMKVKGRYYLSAAEGGTGEGHSQVIFRADQVTGPYAPFAGNPILTQRDLPADRPLPVTSAGHADMVETPAGDWWAVFLATRPYAGNFYNTGRETFLLPVTWRNGWPIILDQEKPVPYLQSRPRLPVDTAPQPTSGAFEVRTGFEQPTLPLDWVMLRNPRDPWWTTGDGLTLRARPVRLADEGNPSFLGRRQQHRDIEVTTRMRFRPLRDGDKAGLAIVQNDHFYYFVGVARDKGALEMRVERRAGREDPRDGVVLVRRPLQGDGAAPILLRITATGGKISFAYGQDGGGWEPLLNGADATILSTATAGGFIGSTVGAYAVSAAR